MAREKNNNNLGVMRGVRGRRGRAMGKGEREEEKRTEVEVEKPNIAGEKMETKHGEGEKRTKLKVIW